MSKVDNYIKYLNAFYEWEQRYYLSPIQQCILMRILHRINKAGWCEWIKIANSELINELRISSPKTFIDNRNRLMELGLIQYKAGKKGKPSNYKLNMPQKKEIIYSYSFGKKENDEKKGIPNIPKSISNNIPKNDKNEKKGILNIPKSISKSISKSILNKSETPHEQCVPDDPKHINNKHIYLTTFDIYNNTQENLTCECVSATTNEKCKRKSTYCINGKNYCNQHSKEILNGIETCTVKSSSEKTHAAKNDIHNLIDNYTENKELRLELKEYLKMRKAKKVPNTKRAIQLNLDKLSKLADNDEEKIAIVQKTIEHGWLSFFPNSEGKTGVNQERKTSYDIDEQRRYCQDTLMRSRSSGTFLETLKEEYKKPNYIEVEVT